MSNIYLNEFDRYIKHTLKPLAYMRYGDDWLCFAESSDKLKNIRSEALDFLNHKLYLNINPKIDFIQPTHNGVAYLGVEIWPTGQRLQLAVRDRVYEKLTVRNAASYRALVSAHEKQKRIKKLDWRLLE